MPYEASVIHEIEEDNVYYSFYKLCVNYLSNKYSYYQFRQPTDRKQSMNRNYFHAYSPFHYDLFKHERSIDYKCSILPSFHTFNSIKPCRTQTIQNVSCEFSLQSHSPTSPLHSHFYVYRSLAWRQ